MTSNPVPSPDPRMRHPDLAEALFIDVHGPAFLAPWREHREVAAELGLGELDQPTAELGAGKGLDPHELAGLPLARRPDEQDLRDHWYQEGQGGDLDGG